jgi:hypothetical protein
VQIVPGFGHVLVPRQAIYAKRQLLFQVAITVPRVGGTNAHRRAGLWIAPAHGGGTCWWEASGGGGGSSGCGAEPRILAPLPIRPDFYEGTLCCQVGANVARIELRFEDGDRIELHPRAEFILAAIPLRHYTRGHRLEEEVAFSASGKAIATRSVATKRPGMYPCARPSVLLYGFKMCP